MYIVELRLSADLPIIHHQYVLLTGCTIRMKPHKRCSKFSLEAKARVDCLTTSPIDHIPKKVYES
ncbi:hypothetical protein QUA95_24785 [Microcoleus sp. F10_A2]